MNLNFNILGLLNSGGGAQAFAAPTNFTAVPLTTTSNRLQWIPDGPDSFKLYRNTSDTIVGATLINSPTASTFSFDDTGLTIATTYYYFLVGVHGSTDSEAASANCKTIKFMPEIWLEPTGAIANTNNQYGEVDAVNVFGSPLKSIINTSRTISFTTPQPTLVGANNRVGGMAMNTGATDTYRLSSDIVLEGAFVIHWEGVFLNVANNTGIIGKAGEATYNNIRLATSASVLLVRATGINKTLALSRTILAGEKLRIRLRRDVSDVMYCKINDETETSIAGVTGTFTFDQPFGWNSFWALNAVIERFVITEQPQDDEYDSQVWNYLSQPAYTSATPITSIPFSGITWNDLPANGEILATDLWLNGLGGGGQYAIAHFGDGGRYAIIRSAKPNDITDKQADVFWIFDCAQNKYSQRFNLGEVLPVDYDDGHNISSVFVDDNKIMFVYYPDHWEDSNPQPNSLRFISSAPNYDVRTLTELGKRRNLIGSGIGVSGQYQQPDKVGSNRIMLYTSQTTGSTQQDSASILQGTDFWNNFEKITIAATGVNGHWIYSRLIRSAQGHSGGVILNLTTTTNIKWGGVAFLKSVGTDWGNVQNASGSFTKNVRINGPVTEAELYANCLISDNESATSNDPGCHWAFQKSDGSYYGLLFSSEGGFEYFTLATDGTLVKKAVTIDVNEVTGPHDEPTGTGGGKNNPVALQVGSTIYIYFHSLHSTDKWDLRYVTSTDGGDTWSASTKISDSDTSVYWRLNPSREWENSSYGLVVANRDNGNVFVRVAKTA